MTKPENERSSPIFLYFGHGSGSQYIRPRVIKRLRCSHSLESRETSSSVNDHNPPIDKTYPVTCATTLLFGCSSASLTQYGEYAPFGTPVSYLLAGAPAVLGCLWDVTDGDCDRFAAKTLEEWGLLDRGACVIEDGIRSRKQKRRRQEDIEMTRNVDKGKSDGKRLCLSEAAAKARGECYLKYLNGAAMVVYGVPVHLGIK